MNTFETIANRRSYRGKYLPTPVPREHLKMILEAGYHAPSGCNKQTTSFIAVDDPEIMDKMRTVIHPPKADCPAMICVLTQRIIAYQDKTFFQQDYAAAIQNMLLAVEALGYASCWIEGHVTGDDRIGYKMQQFLNVPDDYELICFLPVGIPAKEIPTIHKKPFEERAWLNGFKQPI